ncbi:EmrB/QacA subfamily drug resistance transporter [Bradyrhizobium sp. GM5.1]
MLPASMEHADGLPQPQRGQAVLTIALGIIMAVVDSAIANVALPTIAADLDASPAFSIWIVNGYQLAITISLLPLASLGEIVGYRRVYLVGLVLFTFASALCALAHTLPLLTIARIVQGFGAAGIMSVNAALVRFTYPRSQLGRGIGLNALVVAFSAAVGPTLAAGILAFGSWPWLFAINVPLGVVTLVLGLRSLPHTRPASHSFDWQSAGLSAITFGVGIAAVDSVGHGEAAITCLVQFAIALVAGALLIYRETHMASPLLPIDLLRIPVFALSIATSIASFCGQMLAPFVAIPFYLQSRFGYSAVHMGLLITPWPIAVAFAAPLAGRLVEHYPAGLLGGIGLTLFACGLAALALLPAAPTPLDVVWRMALAGAGFGLFQTPNNRTMIAAAPRERAGGASGMLGTARLLGQTTGAALVALFLGRYPIEGTRIALLTGVGFALCGAALSMLRLSSAGVRAAPSMFACRTTSACAANSARPFGKADFGCVRRASHLHHLGAIFRQQCCDQLAFLGHLFRGRLRRWRCAAFDGKANRQEEFVLSRWRAHAEHTGRLAGHVLERVRRVGRDVDGRPRTYGITAKGEFKFAFEQREHLLEVVAVRRGPAAGGHQHVDQAIASCGLRARHQNRVGAAGHRDMRHVSAVGIGDRQGAAGIVGGDRGS